MLRKVLLLWCLHIDRLPHPASDEWLNRAYLRCGHTSEIVLVRRLEQWAEAHQQDLETHIDSTGVIATTPPKSTSARRYLRFAKAIHLHYQALHSHRYQIRPSQYTARRKIGSTY
jgi:hypothetical protein